MSELEGIKLNPDNQLLLEVPSLRLPYELSRRNLKTAQKHIEKERDNVLAQLKTATNMAMAGQSKEQAAAQLGNIVTRLKMLKQKLEELERERKELNVQAQARIKHVSELWQIPTVSDVKYEAWSKVRLDRLLVDYMLRKGYTESARLLAQEKGIEAMVDIDLFSSAQNIASALRKGSLTEALGWCSEHKPLLKNLKTSPSEPNLKATAAATAAATTSSSLSSAAAITLPPIKSVSDLSGMPAIKVPAPSATALEFQLRLQQYVNLLFPLPGSNGRRDVVAARAHATKYLAPHIGDPNHKDDVSAAGALLIYSAECPPLRYAGYFSPARWSMLAELFTATFLELWGLPRDAGLKRALKAGLTALKTPSCHSVHLTAESSVGGAPVRATSSGLSPNPGSGSGSGLGSGSGSGSGPGSGSADATTGDAPAGTVPGTRLCPICSTELNALAKDLPYAHHSQSLVDPDTVVLPNARIYGRAKLTDMAEKLGLREGMVKDPVTGEEFNVVELRKVFIM